MKTRNGFVSNSSSSSFVVCEPQPLKNHTCRYCDSQFPSDEWRCPSCGAPHKDKPADPPLGNPQEALDWLKSRTPNSFAGSIFVNSDEVDMRWENGKVVEYEGCCDRCYGPFREWTESEFLSEFKHDEFVLSDD